MSCLVIQCVSSLLWPAGVVLASLVCAGGAAARDSKKLPERIVALAPNTAEIICDLGACERIVGVSKFCVYPPQLSTRAQIGGLYDADLEKIVSLRPDLLITRGHHDALERLSEQLGIPLYRDQTDSLAGIGATIYELGTVLGRETEAAKVAGRFEERIQALRSRVQGRPRSRVLLTISRDPQRLSNILTAGKGTFLSEMLEVAGAVNVFGHLDMRYPEVSVESIIAAQPDCIIELMPEVDVKSREASLRAQWAGLSMIPAVRDGRVFFYDDENALIPSPRYTQFIEKVSFALHPPDGD